MNVQDCQIILPIFCDLENLPRKEIIDYPTGSNAVQINITIIKNQYLFEILTIQGNDFDVLTYVIKLSCKYYKKLCFVVTSQSCKMGAQVPRPR